MVGVVAGVVVAVTAVGLLLVTVYAAFLLDEEGLS